LAFAVLLRVINSVSNEKRAMQDAASPERLKALRWAKSLMGDADGGQAEEDDEELNQQRSVADGLDIGARWHAECTKSRGAHYGYDQAYQKADGHGHGRELKGENDPLDDLVSVAQDRAKSEVVVH
jgi:hypothetical protein